MKEYVEEKKLRWYGKEINVNLSFDDFAHVRDFRSVCPSWAAKHQLGHIVMMMIKITRRRMMRNDKSNVSTKSDHVLQHHPILHFFPSKTYFSPSIWDACVRCAKRDACYKGRQWFLHYFNCQTQPYGILKLYHPSVKL